MFGGWGKMCAICICTFCNLKIYKEKNVPGYPITQYFGQFHPGVAYEKMKKIV